MPYPDTFTNISFLFKVTATDEIAVTSLNICTPLPGDYDAVASHAAWTAQGAPIATEFLALMNTSALNWAAYSDFTEIKFVGKSVGGENITEPTVHTVADAGGTNNNIHPQLTVCCSLRSGQTLGSGNRGRMYLPHTMLTLAGGTVDGTGHAAVATAFGNFITSMNAFANTVSAGARVCIMSQKGAGTKKQVRQVRVGTITDTQRRRRDQLAEIYAVAAVPA